MDDQRALLDQLMGRTRDLPDDEKAAKRRKFYDKDVCKFYLAGLSPYSLFRNSKSASFLDNYGNSYTKEEDEDCKVEYDALPQDMKDKYGYDYQLFDFLTDLLRKCDQKVQKNKQRLDSEVLGNGSEITEEDVAKLVEINDKIKMLNDKVEAAGDEVSR